MAIVLFTDFGSQYPYVGQLKAVLARDAPGEAITCDVPRTRVG